MYSDTEFEDVFNKADEKWYKLNNLNQYEEYGVYGSGRTITTYEGKLTIDEEITPSRLPQGYTEVEYIENTGTSYINTDYYPNQDTRIIAEMQVVTYNSFGRLLGAGNHNTANTISCDYVDNGNTFEISWGGYTGWTQYSVTSNYDKHTYDWNKNSFYIDGTLLDSKTYTAFTCSYKLGIFNVLESGNVPTSNTERYFYGKLYSFKIYDNDTLVRDFVPAKRDSDSKYGLYDVVNDVFYISPNSTNFIGGSEIALTATCEYQYSGGSWVNVGEVSGSTTQTVWYDPPSSGDNANFNIGHYWGENYKMVWTVYLQGSYSNDTGSFWKYSSKSPIEFSFYSNGYYFDLHDPTSTTSPSVNSGDYSYRIMRTSTLRNYVNGQVMDITLTYGSVKIELVDSGTTIESTGSTKTGYSWYDGLYEPSVLLQSTQKVHLSRIQVYNASNVLVNDLKFVKNNGVSGSQEISMYDSVLDVTYNNTNSNTPTYHIVGDGGGVEYPIYYDEIQDPPNNVTFTSMTEAESYECPYVGMIARIDGVRYIFSGDSQSGYEWVVYSRLPQGYTEVEYIQNTGFSYINTDFMPNTNTRVVVDMQLVTTSEFPRLFGAGTWNATTGLHVAYEGGYLRVIWFTKTSWTITNIPTSYDRRTIDLDKNKLYVNGTQVASTTYSSLTQATQKLALFTHIDNGQPAPQELKRYFQGKLYSAQLYDNGTMIRNYVPCINPNNVVGLYDLVNGVFYTAPSEFTTDTFVAGNLV